MIYAVCKQWEANIIATRSTEVNYQNYVTIIQRYRYLTNKKNKKYIGYDFYVMIRSDEANLHG